ncbi:hypothetical protein [Elizabethkingia ursingii]|uniref:Lipoprotein n=1 Tax=Elizabethkingia ursingii TaxID=1756150 RepID=A0ABX3NA33_9FLAO|nr:hypothetical protein [Elizabethkingia ursingii]OPB91209.1 hypothetical protein BB021_04435 [Elizabethkingia ursingii]
MIKKIFYSLCSLVICLFIIGCVHDERETTPSSNIPNDITTKAYVKLSPWNENEAFIKNVRSSFIKNIDLEKFKNEYGSVYWDYTISFPDTQEAGLAIPIVKNNDVVAILKATLKDNRINLKWVNAEDPKEFFRSLIFKDKSLQSYAQGVGKGVRNGLSASIDKVAVMEYYCTYKTISIGCPNGQTDCPPVSGTVSECSWRETGGQDFESIAPPSDGGGGGGGGGGGYNNDMYYFVVPKEYIRDLKGYLSVLDRNKGATLRIFAEKVQLFSDPGNVGHAFISISQGDKTVTFGFYPDNPDGKLSKSLSSPGIMGDNSGSAYTNTKDYGYITSNSLGKIIDTALSYNNMRYDLAGNNCSSFVSDVQDIIFEKSGVSGMKNPDYIIYRMGGDVTYNPGKGPDTKRN